MENISNREILQQQGLNLAISPSPSLITHDEPSKTEKSSDTTMFSASSLGEERGREE